MAVDLELGPRRSTSCPFVIERPAMTQRWETLTFLHWRYDVAVVQDLLPPGIVVDAHEGAAWVGLVLFHLRIGPGRHGSVPWVSRFAEVNVRTYVRDAPGRCGIWFLSLDAARLGAVALARLRWRLPYFWSDVQLDQAGSRRTYECRRRWPASPGVASRVTIEVGRPLNPHELTGLDQFLTARWIFFIRDGRRRKLVRAWHEPWTLNAAATIEWDDRLCLAAGLPRPQGEPLVRYSPGVEARIGRREPADEFGAG